MPSPARPPYCERGRGGTLPLVLPPNPRTPKGFRAPA
jgi:hypothetical protein